MSRAVALTAAVMHLARGFDRLAELRGLGIAEIMEPIETLLVGDDSRSLGNVLCAVAKAQLGEMGFDIRAG